MPNTEIHNIPPVWNEQSKILILGSFPSVKSREDEFFYAHPQNRFWKVISALHSTPIPQSIFDKKQLLLNCNIALWDVIASCEINGSSDSSIQNVQVNDILPLLSGSSVTRIFANGNTAAKLYEKYLFPITGIIAVRLPSTSPANAAWSFDRLLEAWKKIL